MDSCREFLRLRDIKKTFIDNKGQEKIVLEGINLQVGIGDSLAIVGPSGCGKTTLLLMIAGLIKPTKGLIELEGAPLNGPDRRIALVLQHYGLFPWKTVGQNMMLGVKLQNIQVTEDEIEEMKKDLGIEGLDHFYPGQLSGGQRQRVAIARAILLKPLLLLLDEPFAAIDTITRERLQNGLLRVFNQRRFGFIIVTHNIEEAVFLGKKIMVLNHYGTGEILMMDNPEMGSLDYRNTSIFFERCLELRRVLEGIS
ncbi:MAG: ATP-binding cassette domain-containing protein [Syntrophorhabdaceae bacterium]|nr:ATP-binding cassette domain-containing protein [Syntrophorhabdaceae bacterium]